MPDYGDDRGFGRDIVNPFEQTARAGSMPGYRDRPSDREIDKIGALYNETIAGDRANTGVAAPFWAQKNIPSYPPENPYGAGLGRFETSYVPQNRKFRQDPMSKILNTLGDFYGDVKGRFQEWGDPTDDQVMLGDGSMDETLMAEIGLPQSMDWQKEKRPISLEDLLNLDPEGSLTQEEIAEYLGIG